MATCRTPRPNSSWLGGIRIWFSDLYEAVLAPLAGPALVILLLFLFFRTGGGGSSRQDTLRMKVEREQQQREDLDHRIRAVARREQEEAARREQEPPAWRPFQKSTGDPFAPIKRRP